MTTYIDEQGITVHHFKYPDDYRAIRARLGDRCLKCDYFRATPHCIGDGTMLCRSCYAEWMMLTNIDASPKFKITFDEWMKMPSLRQFIDQYRKEHKKSRKR